MCWGPLEQHMGCQGGCVSTCICGSDGTHPLRQQNPLCSQIMKYSISRLLYYYKYNSRKTYFRINFFWLRGSELFWGGSQLSKEARVVRALKIQSDSLGSSPCFVLYDLRQVPSPLWTCFCIAKWGKCLPCWVSLWWCTWIHWIYCKVLYNIIYTIKKTPSLADQKYDKTALSSFFDLASPPNDPSQMVPTLRKDPRLHSREQHEVFCHTHGTHSCSCLQTMQTASNNSWHKGDIWGKVVGTHNLKKAG